MSGTSMDGIDAALIETDGTPNLIKEIHHVAMAYEAEFKVLLKAAELAVRQCQGDLNKAERIYPETLQFFLQTHYDLNMTSVKNHLQALSAYLYQSSTMEKQICLSDVFFHSTYLHSIAVKKLLESTHCTSEQIDVIGYHGQTFYHYPEKKVSVVIGDGQYLADSFNVKVVNDFRRQDMLAGGQGAPFAPLYHHALAIRDKIIPAAIINCGGIANITLIHSIHETDLLAYDTGPGNGLIDAYIRQKTNGKEFMDRNGRYGSKGKVHEDILCLLYEKSVWKNNQNYFSKSPPKSLDINDMYLIPEIFSLAIEDACATLEAFTAMTMVDSLDLVNMPIPKTWVLAGGGWKNPVIKNALKEYLMKKIGHAEIYLADEIGWNSQALEAQIFAYLAVRSLQHMPLSLPTTTNVPQAITGGKLHVPVTAQAQD